MNDHALYAIIPFYNYSNSKYRLDNLYSFIDEYKTKHNLRIVVVEAIHNGERPLQDLSNDIYAHVKYPIKQKLWHKENLINVAIKQHLPKDWNYVCWIDSDIHFLNKNWVNDAINELSFYDFIQLFDSAILLKEKNEVFSLDNNFLIYSSWLKFCKNKFINPKNKFELINKKLYEDLQKEIVFEPHSGFAWGTNRNFYNKIEKLWDYNLIGGADDIIAKCVTQNIQDHPFKILYSEEYEKTLLQYYNRFGSCKYNNIRGSIVHYWHGSYKSRKYHNRHEILKSYNFSPLDVKYDENSMIFIDIQQLSLDLEDYFNEREN